MESGDLFDEQVLIKAAEEASSTTTTTTEEDDGFWKEDKKPKRLKSVDPSMIEPFAIMLYGLIHQRYLLTREGLSIMANRFTHSEFGTCPRYFCEESPVLPMGRFDETGKERVHLYCPVCLDIYNPPSSIDGAHFGTTYCHLLFLTYPELIPSSVHNYQIYEPRIFGFRVSPFASTGPQNQWLRIRPQQK
ncbi:casein kinase II, regulatory subunit [Pilaira anomala]|nr:casein kinase II, regulatory subunit [Pilaira anomala]